MSLKPAYSSPSGLLLVDLLESSAWNRQLLHSNLLGDLQAHLRCYMFTVLRLLAVAQPRLSLLVLDNCTSQRPLPCDQR